MKTLTLTNHHFTASQSSTKYCGSRVSKRATRQLARGVYQTRRAMARNQEVTN